MYVSNTELHSTTGCRDIKTKMKNIYILKEFKKVFSSFLFLKCFSSVWKWRKNILGFLECFFFIFVLISAQPVGRRLFVLINTIKITDHAKSMQFSFNICFCRHFASLEYGIISFNDNCKHRISLDTFIPISSS